MVQADQKELKVASMTMSALKSNQIKLLQDIDNKTQNLVQTSHLFPGGTRKLSIQGDRTMDKEALPDEVRL